jgi:hypothetical protein
MSVIISSFVGPNSMLRSCLSAMRSISGPVIVMRPIRSRGRPDWIGRHQDFKRALRRSAPPATILSMFLSTRLAERQP